MNNARCLGLVGGLGVGATVHYYETLAKAHEVRGCALDIVIAHAERARVFEYAQASDRNGLAEYLNGYILRLKAAGAEVAAIPAVTPHFCIGELGALSPLPVVNIFPPVVRELAARSAKRVAIFGTRFVIESTIFGELDATEFIQWRPHEVDLIHKTYVEVARTGQGTKQQHRELTDLARTAIKRDGADTVILAGTDLALLFNESNTDFPYIDCAALHIQAIVGELLGEASA
jgi:aspartate racemase